VEEKCNAHRDPHKHQRTEFCIPSLHFSLTHTDNTSLTISLTTTEVIISKVRLLHTQTEGNTILKVTRKWCEKSRVAFREKVHGRRLSYSEWNICTFPLVSNALTNKLRVEWVLLLALCTLPRRLMLLSFVWLVITKVLTTEVLKCSLQHWNTFSLTRETGIALVDSLTLHRISLSLSLILSTTK